MAVFGGTLLTSLDPRLQVFQIKERKINSLGFGFQNNSGKSSTYTKLQISMLASIVSEFTKLFNYQMMKMLWTSGIKAKFEIKYK